MWQQVGAYVQALLRHWLALVGGSSIIVLLGLWERRSQQNVPWSVFSVAAALALLPATFLAWRDEYKEHARARQQLDERPRLRLVFDPQSPLYRRVHDDHTHFKVAIANDGNGRAEGVRVIVADLIGVDETTARGAIGGVFGYVFDNIDGTRHSVPPTSGTPTVFVPVLDQYVPGPFEKGGDARTRLKLVDEYSWGVIKVESFRLKLTLDAAVRSEPLWIEFTVREREPATARLVSS